MAARPGPCYPLTRKSCRSKFQDFACGNARYLRDCFLKSVSSYRPVPPMGRFPQGPVHPTGPLSLGESRAVCDRKSARPHSGKYPLRACREGELACMPPVPQFMSQPSAILRAVAAWRAAGRGRLKSNCAAQSGKSILGPTKRKCPPARTRPEHRPRSQPRRMLRRCHAVMRVESLNAFRS